MAIEFNDGKDPEALRTIGEVTKALGIRQHVLRYWEEQFPMLKPVKRSGGRRYYRPEDIALVAEIDRLVHREGYTLRGARQAIETGTNLPPAGNGSDDASLDVPSEDAAHSDGATVARLKSIRNRLSEALTSDD